MRLGPIQIPSDASKAPILPGISLELFDLVVFFILISPVFIFSQSGHGHHSNINLLTAVPGGILSIPLVWMPPKEGQRGWVRLLARITYTFLSTKQYKTSWNIDDDDFMGVVSVGKKDWRK